MTEIFMPKAGMDMKEGTLIRWLKEVGDPVELDEPIMEIETDKITMEAEAPASGILLAKLIEDGTTVPVLQTIGWIGQPGEEIPGGPAESPAPSAEPVSENSAPESGASAAAAEPEPVLPAGGFVPATPFARLLAKENGISPGDVPASAPLKAADILRYLESAKPQPAAQAPAEDRTPVRIPLTPLRKAIARNMYQSLQSMAQTSDSVEVDVTELMAIRKALAVCADQIGVRVSVNDLLSYAAVQTVKRHPLANASFADTEIIQYPYINLCTAVATEQGLVSPVIHNADRMGLLELSKALHDVTSRARAQKLTAADLEGGTFTLTNMGIFPVDNFNPILPAPQSCILGFGRCVEKPAAYRGEICLRTRMVLSVTYDHRVFDGGEVGMIMKHMKEYLEDPESFLKTAEE